MKISLSNLERSLLSLIRKIGTLADQKDLPVYIVGGIVRDHFLKRKNSDLDIVVEGDAIDFANLLGKKMKAAVTAHEPFKTATVFLPNDFKFDLVTARKESYPAPGALPVVKNGTIEDDLFRRDFTVNAMACSINQGRFGEVVDPFSGLKDLKMKKIRILHKKSFIDDPTRILRAVRFEQRFNFQIEKETETLLKDAVGEDAVSSVKPQRYFAEFKKILEERNPEKPLKRLSQAGGLSFLSSEIIFNRKKVVLLGRVNESIGWFCKKFPKDRIEPWLICFMALVHEAPFDLLKEIGERFNLAREERESILFSEFARKTLERLSVKLSPHKAYSILKPFNTETILLMRALSARMARQNIDNFLVHYAPIKLSIGGNDLKRLGIPEGRAMSIILKEILEKKIDGKIISKKDELQLAGRLKDREVHHGAH